MRTIIIAAYNINRSFADNFLAWNSEVFSELGFNVIIVSDVEFDVDFEWAKVIKYPSKQNFYSVSKTINYGLRQIGHKGLVIKSDPDIFFTKEVLEYVISSVSEGNGMVCHCSNIDYAEQAKIDTNWARRTKRRRGRGACFALMMSDWEKLHGFNEKIWGWGGDDNDIWDRAVKTVKMVENSKYPLYHINHKQRKDSKFFPIRSKYNLRVGPWNDPNWGSGGV